MPSRYRDEESDENGTDEEEISLRSTPQSSSPNLLPETSTPNHLSTLPSVGILRKQPRATLSSIELSENG